MSSWNWTEATFASILKRIIERNNDTEQEEDSEFNQGRHQGYWEVLDMIKNDLSSRGYDMEEFIKKYS